MKILFVADGRSPITINWLKYFVECNIDIHLVSTYSCSVPFELASFNIIPVAFSNLLYKPQRLSEEGPVIQGKSRRVRWLRRMIPVQMRTWYRQQLGPITLSPAAKRLRKLIGLIKPDLVHALRIPFEGMLAAMALSDIPDIPFIVSVWGNDFTLHAPSSKKMASYTRLTMNRANALHTDTFRDQGLANQWGYDARNPMIVQPCGGGINLDVFYPANREKLDGPVTIINPRGMRAYVRNDTFFKSIPMVLKEFQDVRFLCPAMLGESQAESWVTNLGIDEFVTLLPLQSSHEIAELYRRSLITISISTHDGTPNSLLEALACGCFPIVGDIESLREWITQKENGILVNPGNSRQLADAILTALQDENLRSKARPINFDLVRNRAEYQHKMAETLTFYKSVIS